MAVDYSTALNEVTGIANEPGRDGQKEQREVAILNNIFNDGVFLASAFQANALTDALRGVMSQTNVSGAVRTAAQSDIFRVEAEESVDASLGLLSDDTNAFTTILAAKLYKNEGPVSGRAPSSAVPFPQPKPFSRKSGDDLAFEVPLEVLVEESRREVTFRSATLWAQVPAYPAGAALKSAGPQYTFGDGNGDVN